jgi:hypothetical protein
MSSKTNVENFIGELNGGATIEQLGLVLSEAALATIVNGTGNKKGKVSLDFTVSQMGDNDQVIISCKLSKSIPTKRGKKSEENITDTPFYVGKQGVLTIDVPRESLSGQYNLKEQLDGTNRLSRVK